MTTPFTGDQTTRLRHMLGYVAVRRVLVIGVEEQVDDFVDNLYIVLSGMGHDTIVVGAQTVLAMVGTSGRYDETADVTLAVTHFDTQALGIMAEAYGGVLLAFSDSPEGIKSTYTLLKKIAVLQGGVGIRTMMCGAYSVDSAVCVFGNLANAVGQHLNTRIDFVGYLPENQHVEPALSLGKLAASAFPTSFSAMAFRQLAEETLSWVSAEAQAGDDSVPSRVAMSAWTPAWPADESAQAVSMSTPTTTLGATVRTTELVYRDAA